VHEYTEWSVCTNRQPSRNAVMWILHLIVSQLYLSNRNEVCDEGRRRINYI